MDPVKMGGDILEKHVVQIGEIDPHLPCKKSFRSFNKKASNEDYVHRVAVTWIPKVRWTFDEIPKMSPGGARTHDPAATLSKLQPNLGIQVTATRCRSFVATTSIF